MNLFYECFLGPIVPLALFAAGLYLLIRLRFFFCLHPRRVGHVLFGGQSSHRATAAVCLALGGTMGVGNITGVALALLVGGAGAVFWMLVSAFFAMAVKYAEVVLAMATRRREANGRYYGGAPYYMRRGSRHGALSLLFSLLCVLCSVLQGSILQGNAIGEALAVTFGAEPSIIGISLSIGSFLLLLFCRPLLGRICAGVVPLVTALYLFICLRVLGAHAAAIGPALRAVWRGAFTMEAGVGGVLGFLTCSGLRVGCARGLLSNEAGCGTAPLAHVTAEGTTPCGQGIFGILEVFLDTVVVCTLTALTCLVSGAVGEEGAPFAYVANAVETVFGEAARPLLTLSVCGFAIATILSWAFYGLTCLDSLARATPLRLGYLLLYCSGLTVGCLTKTESVFSCIDVLLGVMTLINLSVLIKKADRVVALSAEAGLIVKRKRANGHRGARRGPQDAPVHP